MVNCPRGEGNRNHCSFVSGRLLMAFAIVVIVAVGCIVLMDADGSDAETSGSCGENLTWSIDEEGNLIITGTGPMTDYSYNSIRWGGNTVRTVSLPDGLTSIGNYAFYECTSLASVTIPDSVTSIGMYAFYECTSLASVTIPDSVAYIGPASFRDCTSLASVTIGNSVTTIGGGAFYGCTSLASVTIPNSVTFIGDDAFIGCTSLTTITVDFYNPTYSSENGVLFNKNKTTIMQYPAGKTDMTYIIPDSVTSIGMYAFYECTSLASVTIPDSVTSIGTSAFFGCTSLASVTIGNSVTSIGSSIFYGCTSLTSVTIPDSVTSIGTSSFSGCTSLTSVTIPDSVTSIGASAFSGCTSLASVTIPDSVTSIGDNAFNGCTSLTSVTIPDSVTSIGTSSFSGCKSLFEVINLSSLIITKGSSDNGDVGYYAMNVFTSVEDSTVGTIDGKIVYGRSGNTNYLVKYIGNDDSVILPVRIDDENYKIHNYAFSGCTSLASVTIPDSVTSIGWNAFSGCTSLASVTIPDSVISIGNDAFFGCTSLTAISVGTSNPNYSSENGVLFNKTKTILIQYPAGKTDMTYTIPDSVRSIGEGAFYGCTSLASVTIPDSVISIGNDAFRGCTSLAFVTIPDSVTSIGWNVFNGCTSLASVTIPDSVTYIGPAAFRGCTSLASVTIPDSVTSIGSSAFYGCTSLASVTIGNSVTSIGSQAFYGCNTLTSVDVPCNNALNIEKESSDNGYVAYYAEEVQFHHNYSVSFEWSADGHACTVHVVCANDHDHDHDIDADVGSSVKVQPTCTAMGTTMYSVSGTYDGFDYASTKDVVDIPVLGHAYSATYGWADDRSTCTVHVVCANDHDHDHDIDADVGSSVKVQPTCTAMGTTTYSVSGTYDGFQYSSTKDVVDIAVLGHSLVPHDAKAATCTEAGWNAYDTCSRCDYTTYVEIPALGHAYSATYGWADDGSTCTVHVVCANDHNHDHDTDAAVGSSVKVQPTCTAMGTTTYSVSGTYDGFQYSDTKDVVDISVLGHDLVPHDAKSAVCTEVGWNAYDTCSRCDYTTYVEIPALGHVYSATYGWSADGHACTIHIVCANDQSHNHDITNAVVQSWVKTAATTSSMGTTAYSVSGIYDGFQYSDEKYIQDIPALEPEISQKDTQDGKTYANTVTESQTTQVTEIFSTAKDNGGSVEISVPTTVASAPVTIVFDNSAVSSIATSDNVTIEVTVKENAPEVAGAEQVIEVNLNGATFSGGKAKVTVPLSQSVPDGKVLRVYFINGNQRQDMNATVVNGNAVFETDHFSTYAIFYEDAPSDPESSQQFPITYVAIGGVAVLALAGAAFFLIRRR